MASTESTREELKNGIKDASQGFRTAVNAASNAASNIGSEVKKGVEEVGAAVKVMSKDAAARLSDGGNAALDTVKEKSREVADSLDKEIRGAPFLSLGIAFGLGVLLSGLIRR